MSSSVFFRFKSQKEPSRVAFDGTGISVFELKREIIMMNKLGDGTDFELVISSEDTNEIFDDDTSIIPRSTTVIAKRLPPIKPGRGGAARYISGKMPQNARTSHRTEMNPAKGPFIPPALTTMNGAQTEEQKIAAVFKMGADQWAQQQQEMANATPVHRSGHNKGKPVNVPDHPPPSGYICYRCGEKGHWIQVCPTNDDPAYENRPRVKRTTGIPRSFLKTIEKPAALANDGTADEAKQPAGIMVNAEGEWVIAEPDKAAWDQYQAKAKVSAAAQEAAKQGSKELQDRGLECPIDKRLFVDPTETPCCQRTFCHDCITNALLENDLRCPECSTENILIDDLTPDEDMVAKIRSYEEVAAVVQIKERDSKSPSGGQQEYNKPPLINGSLKPSSPHRSQMTNDNPKKRSAESDLVNDRKPASKDPAFEKPSIKGNRLEAQNQTSAAGPNMRTNQQKAYSSGNYMMPHSVNGNTFPSVNSFMPTGITMDPTIGVSPAFQNPLMMANGSFMPGDWNMWGVGYQQRPQNMQHSIMPNGAFHQHNPFMNTNTMNGMSVNGAGMNGRGMSGMNGHGRGSFANQQRTTFSSPSTNDEDSAYFRKPVNPHRHQARRNVQRPTDYREI